MSLDHDPATGSAYPIDKKPEVSTTDRSEPYNDAPPAYIAKDDKAQSSNIRPTSATIVMGAECAPYEDPLLVLTKFDTWFLVDDSGSMSFQGRWKQVC
jgi:hypothetical protein